MADVSDYLEQPDTVVWADLCLPTKEQINELADELGLHELAVEDAVSTGHQRPKIDRYESHLFLSCNAVQVDLEHGKLNEFEIVAFINKRYLITVCKQEGFDFKAVLSRWDRSPDLAKHGVGFLLYGLLDVVVDDYLVAVEEFDDYYDEVSQGLFADEPLDPAKQKFWFDMRRAMVRFHKLAISTREVISSLMRKEQAAVAEGIHPYFQDVYDHMLRVTESTDALRDLVSTIVETNLSLRDYRQNQVVKKVGSWAAIALVPTIITGYFGMNVPYPGYGKLWGAIASAVLIVASVLGLFVLFRKRDWL